MKYYESSADIDASPETIWAILTDAAGYPGWDNGVIEIDGTIAPGKKIKLRAEANPKRAFPVTVTRYDEPTAMTWTGGMPLGLFKGVRTFALQRQDGMTRFAMREEYTGLLLPLMWRSMPDLGPSFSRFARGLKECAERG